MPYDNPEIHELGEIQVSSGSASFTSIGSSGNALMQAGKDNTKVCDIYLTYFVKWCIVAINKKRYIMAFNMQYVNSSYVKAIGYDKDTETLRVQFKDNAICEYEDIPIETYQDFLIAPSKGRFVHLNLFHLPCIKVI